MYGDEKTILNRRMLLKEWLWKCLTDISLKVEDGIHCIHYQAEFMRILKSLLTN